MKIMKVSFIVNLKTGPCHRLYELKCDLQLRDHFAGKLPSIRHQNRQKYMRRLSIAAIIPALILKLRYRNFDKALQLVFWMKMQEEL
jgi:hypothetical protein